MAQEAYDSTAGGRMSRRGMLRSVGAAVGAAVLAPRLVGAQTPPSPVGPPTTITMNSEFCQTILLPSSA